MEKNILDRLRDELRKTGLIGKTKESAEWLIQKARMALGNETPQQRILSAKENKRTRTILGEMYFYAYDAKHKKTLPYYDKFPLVIPIQPYPDGFLGLNLHYLIQPQRAILLNSMSSYMTNLAYDASTRFNMSYKIVASTPKMKIAQPAIKRYLFTHVRSKFIYVPPAEWDAAIFLPAENWSNKRGP